MQKHVRTRSRVRPLPTVKPIQLPLPGIPEPVTPLLDRVRVTIKKHRYPIITAALILFLYLIGQGTVATGLLFAVALFAVNTLVDRQMRGGRDD